MIFDFTLVLGKYRRCTYFFNIIKNLSAEYKIGLLEVPFREREKQRHKQFLQEKFVRHCQDLGATLITEDQVIRIL